MYSSITCPYVLWVAKIDLHNTSTESDIKREQKTQGRKVTVGTRQYLCTGTAQVVAAVDFAQTANIVSIVKSGMHFSILYQSHCELTVISLFPNYK